MNKTITIMDKSYTQWVQNLVKRYRQCQIKAAIKVNEEQLRFNWLLGHDIEEMKFVIHPQVEGELSIFEKLHLYRGCPSLGC